MKLKIVAFLVAVLTVVSAFAACGTVEETESGDAVVIETETETETETDAETQGDTETETEDEFDNPAWNEDASDERKYLFKYTFDNVKSMKAEDNADFALTYHSSYPFELVGGENGYIQNKGDDGYIFITDKNSRLNGKSFIFEAEMTFNSMPVERESNKGKGSYPLSILSWIRKNDSKASYDFAFKMDGDGYIYTTSMTQHTGVKLEVGRKYVISAYYTAEGQVQVLINGKLISTKNFTPMDDLNESILRLCDASRAHFDVEIHSACAYYSNMSQFLSDAERSLSEATNNSLTGVYFAGYTDKDALSYRVGEEMKSEIYLMYNGEVVSVPYFYYTVEGEDGQQMTDGYADGSLGHFTVTTKMSKPGLVMITAYMCDANKNKINTGVVYRGGAAADVEKIKAGAPAPADLEAYWTGVVDECYKGDINLLRFETVSTSKYQYDANKYAAYLFEIGYGDGEIATGYLTYPKNASSLAINIGFRGYGNTRRTDPKFSEKAVVVEMAPHGYRLDDPNPKYPPSNYGFDPVENQDPDTVYFHGMLTRNVLGARLLKAFAGGVQYGKIMLDGKQVQPLGVWKAGDTFLSTGGSQGGFQAIALGALDGDVTEINMALPWFCDIGGQNIGRFVGNLKPAYTDALMYYDCCSLATLIDSDVSVSISAGLGDITCPASGIIAVYNTLNCKKSLSVSQNLGHSYTPPVTTIYRLRNH
ncbi:MAG: acetylxylan esterase [Clostridia bacterium]|nr:acetylxylan esterase [Clostridia bacterium]